MDKKKLATIALAAVVGSGVSVASAKSHSGCKMVKCYGIAKAGKNDCGAKGHSCQGQSTKDGDKSEWMYVAQGTCTNIVGGSTKSGG